MSPDPSPLAITARARSAGSARHDDQATSGDPVVAATPCLDESVWGGWWRDLVVERYRVDRFDAFVPLPSTGCSWSQRVALGRLVDAAMGEVHGPAMTTQLVAEALAVAGFGQVRDLTPDARRTALVRSGWWSDPWPAEDDLRLGVLGSVADALLRKVPPSSSPDQPSLGRSDAPGGVTASETVVAATRAAVLAYAGHVERLAVRSLDATRSLQF